MQTRIIDTSCELERGLETGAELILRGELVAFPTETVYGLGANGTDGAAVKHIFEAKGRPQDNPLILHVYDVDQIRGIWTEMPGTARRCIFTPKAGIRNTGRILTLQAGWSGRILWSPV